MAQIHGRQFFRGSGGWVGEMKVSGWFPQGALNLDPSYVQFMLLWESNATTDLTGGRAQVVQVMGSCKYRRSFSGSPTTYLLLCCPVPNRPPTYSSQRPRGWGQSPGLEYRPEEQNEDQCNLNIINKDNCCKWFAPSGIRIFPTGNMKKKKQNKVINSCLLKTHSPTLLRVGTYLAKNT